MIVVYETKIWQKYACNNYILVQIHSKCAHLFPEVNNDHKCTLHTVHTAQSGTNCAHWMLSIAAQEPSWLWGFRYNFALHASYSTFFTRKTLKTLLKWRWEALGRCAQCTQSVHSVHMVCRLCRLCTGCWNWKEEQLSTFKSSSRTITALAAAVFNF